MKFIPFLAGTFVFALSSPLCRSQVASADTPFVASASAAADPESDAQLRRIAQIARHWDELSSPGTSFVLRETGRSSSPEGQLASYRMYAAGIPSDQTWSLVNLTLDGEIKPLLDGITFDKDGLAICAGTEGTCGTSSKPDDPIELRLQAARGEAKRMALVSSDGKTELTTSVVPFPADGTDKTCHIQLLLGTPDAELLLVSGDGFPPNKWLRIESSSAGQAIQTAPQNVSASGRVFFAIMPYVGEKATGDLKVSVLNGADCNPSATIHWGQGTYKAM